MCAGDRAAARCARSLSRWRLRFLRLHVLVWARLRGLWGAHKVSAVASASLAAAAVASSPVAAPLAATSVAAAAVSSAVPSATLAAPTLAAAFAAAVSSTAQPTASVVLQRLQHRQGRRVPGRRLWRVWLHVRNGP